MVGGLSACHKAKVQRHFLVLLLVESGTSVWFLELLGDSVSFQLLA